MADQIQAKKQGGHEWCGCCSCLAALGVVPAVLIAIAFLAVFSVFAPILGGILSGAENLLQFPLNCTDEAMATAIDTYISQNQPNSPLNGQGAGIVAAAKQYGINPFLQAAQAGHENRFATIPAPRPGVSTGHNNPFGIKGKGSAGTDGPATDGTGGRYAAYANWADGFIAHAKLIRSYIESQGLTSLNQVIAYYKTGNSSAIAESQNYINNVLGIMTELFKLAGCAPGASESPAPSTSTEGETNESL